jgi:hypothetical protein
MMKYASESERQSPLMEFFSAIPLLQKSPPETIINEPSKDIIPQTTEKEEVLSHTYFTDNMNS